MSSARCSPSWKAWAGRSSTRGPGVPGDPAEPESELPRGYLPDVFREAVRALNRRPMDGSG